MGEDSAVARYLAEFVGTYLLVFTVGCNVISGDPTWNATSIACVLMVSIYALGGVSGANFNPAVSFTLALSNKLPWVEAGIYCGVQIVAGILAALSYGALFGRFSTWGQGRTRMVWYMLGGKQALQKSSTLSCFVL